MGSTPSMDIMKLPIFKEESQKIIPQGDYCYNIINIDFNNNPPIIHTKTCPFFEYKKDPDNTFNEELSGFCNYVKSFDFLIDDQVKICGINEHD